MKLTSIPVKYASIIAMVALTLTACFNGSSTESNESNNTHANLKIIMESGSGDIAQTDLSFQAQLTGLLAKTFQKTHPNVKFQYITYNPVTQNNESFQELIEKEKPDMFIVDELHYKLLIEQNKLLPLDIFFRSEAKSPKLNPEIMDHLKALGNGQLYGLTPFFDNLVLYYNKSIFNQYKVPYPNESAISWDNILTTAEQLHARSSKGVLPVYGLYQSPYGRLSGGGLFQLISKSNGVDKVDPTSAQTLQSLISSYHSKSISLPADAVSPTIPTLLDTYGMMRNQAAMTIEGKDFLSQWLRMFYKSLDTEFPWGIVELPDAEGHIKTNKIFAIHEQSTQQKTAWEFLEFIHQSDTIQSMAVLANDFDFELPTAVPNLEEIAGISLEPFYKSKSSPIAFEGQNAKWEQQWNNIYVSTIRAGIGKQSTEQLIEALQKRWSEIPQ